MLNNRDDPPKPQAMTNLTIYPLKSQLARACGSG